MMGEFTHMMRNPIRERDDRIASLEAEVERLKAQNLAMLRVIAQQQEKVESIHAGTPKCKTTDCWLCHGTPENAGPR